MAVGVMTERLDWRPLANCATADPELFFPEKGAGNSAKVAKAICARCVVLQECRDDALERGDDAFGVLGGMTPKERREQRLINQTGDKSRIN